MSIAVERTIVSAISNACSPVSGCEILLLCQTRSQTWRADQKRWRTIGKRTKIKVEKNKVAPPFRTAEVDIIYGEGISREGEILDLAAEEGIVVKSGAWYAYEGNKIGQGRENAKTYLIEHPDILAEVEQKVRDKFFNKDANEASEDVKDAEQTAKEDGTVSKTSKNVAEK